MDVNIQILFSGNLAEDYYCKPFALVRSGLQEGAVFCVKQTHVFNIFVCHHHFCLWTTRGFSLLSMPAAEPLQYDATWCYWLVVTAVYYQLSYILVALSTFAAPKRGTILSGTLRALQGFLPESFMSQKSQSVSFLACNLPSACRLWQHAAAAWMTGTCQRQ